MNSKAQKLFCKHHQIKKEKFLHQPLGMTGHWRHPRFCGATSCCEGVVEEGRDATAGRVLEAAPAAPPYPSRCPSFGAPCLPSSASERRRTRPSLVGEVETWPGPRVRAALLPRPRLGQEEPGCWQGLPEGPACPSARPCLPWRRGHRQYVWWRSVGPLLSKCALRPLQSQRGSGEAACLENGGQS